jgi:MSHA biogenesis protein MshQ
MMRKLLLVVVLWLVGLTAAWAQTYAYRSDVYSWDVVTGAATKTTWNTTCTSYPNSPVSGQPGDDVFAVVAFPAGFTFTFAGTAYASVRILSNGIIQFGPDAGFHRDYTPGALPITVAPGASNAGCANAVPTQLMLIYWRDIDASRNASSGVFYELKGTAPNRRFVITWNNVYLYGQNAFYNFQVILNEDGTFKYQYSAGSSDGSGADVGVQVSTTDYTEYSYNQTFIDPTTGTAILWYLSTIAPAQVGEYRLDEAAWAGTAGEVLDSSGSGRNGVRVGTPQTFTPAKVCRGGNVPANTSATTRDAMDINQNPAGQIGSSGSLTFWYRSSDAWTAGTNHTLFDATTAVATPFFLAKMRSGANDVLRFVLTDSAGTVRTLETGDYNTVANTWVHVGVSWSLAPGTNRSVMQIFVGGIRAGFLRTTTSGSLSPTLASIYVGDNRTSGIAPNTGTVNSGSGDFDEVRVYNFDISAPQAVRDMNVTRANCSPLHHFHIDHYGAGVTCEPESVVISAHDLGHNLVTLVGTSIALTTSTSHGDWSKITANGTLTNSGNGAGTYVFSAESQITLGLADTFAETTNVNVNAGGITENTGSYASHDPNITFADAGFRVVTATLTPAVISTKVAGQNSDAGASAQTLYLQALKTDLSTYACTSLFPNSATPVNVDMAIQCVDPSTCQAVSPSIANSAGTTTTGIALNAATATPATASYTVVPLVFGANSMAQFSFNYPDAGQIRLLASKAIPSTTSYMRGSSNDFVVRPYDFALSGVAATNSATRPPGGLVRAGEAFTTTLTATNLSGNPTRNFGCETAPESVTLTPAVSAPAGGNNGSLYRAAVTPVTFTGLCGSGVATATNLAWSEVGTVTLTGSVTDNNYLGAGPVAGNASAALGRFYPDHFTLAGSVSVPCGFAYMGQSAIDITAGRLEARSLVTSGPPTDPPSDQVVTNYRTNYPVSLASVAFVAADADGVDRSARFSPAPTATAWTAGVYAISGTGMAFARDVAPDGPYDNFNLGLRATDASDYASVLGAGPVMTIGGCTAAGHCTARALASGSPMKARYGRLRVGNTIGSANLRLSMPLETQYRTAGGGYATNTVDSCTTITQNRILQGNALKGLPVLTFAATANPIVFAGGRATLTIDAPHHNGSRDLSVNLTAAGAASNCVGLAGATAAAGDMTYLRETWCAGTQHDPAARAAFDVYPKGDRFIYQRENY